MNEVTEGAADRAPSRAPGAVLPHGLTSFVGRDREVAEVVQLLQTGRLVTVTGAPGSGKSRLAIETVRSLVGRYADGVRYVNLNACTEPGPTQEAIAVALGLSTASAAVPALPGSMGDRDLVAVIADYLANRDLLLVLDDAEHAARAVAAMAITLLQAAPRLRIITASRVPLNVPGELVWHVPALEVPAEHDDTAAILARDSVRLFGDRARAADASFQLDAAAAAAVAEICRRLDGNPLAIELAASRVKTLGVGQLARRLAQSLEVLASGGSHQAEHHQTLLGAIEWGYDLLSRPEQQLFERLSVFRAKFSLAAAEAVGEGDGLARSDIVDLVASLVSKSMLQAVGDVQERSYRLSEALREFASARLASSGLQEAVRDRHAAFHRDFAVARVEPLRRTLHLEVLRDLEAMFPDTMAALEHTIRSGDAVTAHEMVGSLYLFWFIRRHSQARDVATRVLAMTEPVAPDARARALVGAGMLHVATSEIDRGREFLYEAIELANAGDSAAVAAEANMYLGFAHQECGEFEEARTSLTEARRGFEAAGEPWGTAWAEWFLGAVALMAGDTADAIAHLEVALECFREIGSTYGKANALSLLGTAVRSAGDAARAVALHRESLEHVAATGDRHGLAAAHASLGLAYRDAGDGALALEHLEEAVQQARVLGNRPWLAELLSLTGDARLAAGDPDGAETDLLAALETAAGAESDQAKAAQKRALLSLAWWAWESGHFERAVTLFAVVEAQGAVEAPSLGNAALPDPNQALVEAKARLGTQVFESLSEAGRSMSPADATAYAQEPVRETSFAGPRGLSLADIELGERVSAELSDISERREVRVAGIRFAGRRRRPSGEREPLPLDLRTSGRFWLLMALGTTGIWVTLYVFPASRDWWEARDLTINRWFVDLRSPGLTDVMDALHALGSQWFFRPLRWAMLIALVVFKRWRHFFGAIIVFVLVGLVVDGLAQNIGRPRPYVEILAPWDGYAHPAVAVAALAATLTVIGLTLIPRGALRNRSYLASAGIVSVLIVARTYLGVDHLSDGIVGGIFGAAVAVVVFRLFAPDAVFPVVYRRGSSAHLDVTGARGRAIERAVADQLGIEVTEIEPFGLEGSGGSTPLRLTAAGDPDTYLFAKLYSTSHLRADRWYKVGRTILYGALEDEVRFTSVRRLVEYEDYMLLRMKQAGVPSAEPFGFVEITPEREYLIVTEFLQDAQEITKAEVDDAVIDDGLLMIRRLWDAGLAHRDIKPANVLVRDGRIQLIDVAFATIRPSPWRQAVDLANMLIILAMRTDAERVYERALRYFAPEDIAEAFAATRSVTIPSQSRSHLKLLRRGGGPDVTERFRELAPPREPIAIQRWSARRVGLTAAAAFAIALLASLVIENLSSGGLI